MTGIATIVGLVLAGIVLVVSGWRVFRDVPVERPELAVSALLELAVLGYVTARVVDLVGGHRTTGLAVVVVYLVAIALVMPVAALLALVERSRWGAVVLASGALVVCVLFARVDQLWNPRG